MREERRAEKINEAKMKVDQNERKQGIIGIRIRRKIKDRKNCH